MKNSLSLRVAVAAAIVAVQDARARRDRLGAARLDARVGVQAAGSVK